MGRGRSGEIRKRERERESRREKIERERGEKLLQYCTLRLNSKKLERPSLHTPTGILKGISALIIL